MCPKKSGISVYFVCKLCRSSFHQVEHFLEHKKEKHFDEFRNLSCIIFEERVIVVDQSVTSPIVIEDDDDDDDDEIQLISVSPTTKISSSKSEKHEEDTIRISNTPVPSTASDEVILIDHSEKSAPRNSDVSPETDDGICIVDQKMQNELNCVHENKSNNNNMSVYVGKVISSPESEPESKINEESNVCLSIKPKDEVVLFETDSEDDSQELLGNNQSQIQITATSSFQIDDSTTVIAPSTPFQFEFTCGLCLRKFESESHLKIHTGICSLYSGDNDRYCAKCNIKFHLVLELKEHDLNCHQRMIELPADDGRKFSCSHPNCEKRFKIQRHLNEHFRIHTGERPYKCTVNACNEMFRTSSCLSRHRNRVHLDARKPRTVSGKREARKTYFQT